MPRKVFTAGEILTAADVNTNLMDQAVMVFADSTARTAAIPTPVEGMVTYLEDVGGAQGLEVFDGAAFTPVAIVPDPPAILQVVSTTKTNAFTGSSGAFRTVTGLSATITPSSESNKILVLAQVTASMTDTDPAGASFKVTGGNAGTYIGDTSGSLTRAVFGSFQSSSVFRWSMSSFSYPINVLDFPSTTSSVTYQVEGFVSAGSFFVNRSGRDFSSENTRGASSITLMEVAG